MGLVHKLARKGDAKALSSRIERAADAYSLVNGVDEDGYTPLFYAVNNPQPNLPGIELLLRAGADPAYVRINRYEATPKEEVPQMIENARKWGIDLPEFIFDDESYEYRESLLSAAIRNGNRDVVRLLHEHGADLSHRNEDGETAILEAVYGGSGRFDLVRDLLNLGLPFDEVSKDDQTPLVAAYRDGQFDIVTLLLNAGADESRLAWTPLHRAIVVGTAQELRSAITQTSDIEAIDRFERTALELAAFKGDWTLIELLLLAGADPFRKAGEDDLTAMGQAVLGKHEDVVLRLLEMGGSQKDKDAALVVSVEQDDVPTARILLEAGADIDQEMEYSSLIDIARSGAMIRLLLNHGADPADLGTEGRRLLLGFPERDEDALDLVSRGVYLAHRYPREGVANPEEITNPFFLGMIRSGFNAYWARTTFDDPPTFVCGPVEARPPTVWCFDRFGQSTTILPDGRIVLIAGEHEDSYDPDFCIYNDVSVFEPDGRTTIYGYPYEVFPPTDFHSATLVGEWIYILGSLGYMGFREGPMPAWRLSTKDFHIEPLQSSGERPGRIYKHRATLFGDHTIRITGGTQLSLKRRGFLKRDVEEEYGPNSHTYALDLRSMRWSKL